METAAGVRSSVYSVSDEDVEQLPPYIYEHENYNAINI